MRYGSRVDRSSTTPGEIQGWTVGICPAPGAERWLSLVLSARGNRSYKDVGTKGPNGIQLRRMGERAQYSLDTLSIPEGTWTDGRMDFSAPGQLRVLLSYSVENGRIHSELADEIQLGRPSASITLNGNEIALSRSQARSQSQERLRGALRDFPLTNGEEARVSVEISLADVAMLPSAWEMVEVETLDAQRRVWFQVP